MSTLCPYRIIKGDDGLSVKVEWDVHYLTDEQIGTVRKYVAEIEAENAKLRAEVEQWHRLTAGIELPEYPITEFKPKDLERENAKLRELVLDYEELAAKLCDSRECDGCPFDTESTMCKHMHMLLRLGELGVEE